MTFWDFWQKNPEWNERKKSAKRAQFPAKNRKPAQIRFLLPADFVKYCNLLFQELGSYKILVQMSTERLSSCETLAKGCGILDSQAMSQEISPEERKRRQEIIAKLEAPRALCIVYMSAKLNFSQASKARVASLREKMAAGGRKPDASPPPAGMGWRSRESWISRSYNIFDTLHKTLIRILW